MNRRQFLAATAAGAFAAQGRRPPNIVWIMADDLGYGDVGCYGQQYIRTPNIDRLAQEGTRFSDVYSGCTVCAPSRSVLMTGLHMGHTSVRSNSGGVPLLASDITVAEVLKRAGYATGGFGKWGLGDLGTKGVPTEHGFDEFFGYYHQVHAHYYYPRYLIDSGKHYPLAGNEGGKRTSYSHDVIAGRALDFIRRNRAKPFFCYVPFTIPHMELLVPEDSLAQYRGKIPEDKPYIDGSNHYARQSTPRAAYAGMISRMDRDVGRIMALLKELNLDNETIVFFTSDNGTAEPLWSDGGFFRGTGPFRGHKENFYEGGIRVPMIARWPDRIPAGAVSGFPWMFCDFLPTAAELAGTPVSAGLDGFSVLPTLLGRSQKPHEFLYWELPAYQAETGGFRRDVPLQAVRMGEWKAVRPRPAGPLELYNLKQDIGETTDVAARNPQVIARIEAYLKTARIEPRVQKEPKSEWNLPGTRGWVTLFGW
jgi:arylsulfatase A-like enzyme